jgi:hypothetical protein
LSEQQKHIIKRQVLEVKTDSRDSTDEAQRSFRKLYYDHLLPIINEVCDELSPVGQLHTIRHIELDFGAFQMDAPNQGLIRQFKVQFRKVLIKQLKKARRIHKSEIQQNDDTLDQKSTLTFDPSTSAPVYEGRSLELLDYFLHTGLVPWWAPSKRKTLVDDALHDLALLSALQIKEFLLSIFSKKKARKRLIHHLKAEQTLALIKALKPGTHIISVYRELIKLLPLFAKANRVNVSAFSRRLDEGTLLFLCTHTSDQYGLVAFIESMLLHLEIPIRHREVIFENLREYTQKKNSAKEALRQVIDKLKVYLMGGIHHTLPEQDEPSTYSELETLEKDPAKNQEQGSAKSSFVESTEESHRDLDTTIGEQGKEWSIAPEKNTRSYPSSVDSQKKFKEDAQREKEITQSKATTDHEEKAKALSAENAFEKQAFSKGEKDQSQKSISRDINLQTTNLNSYRWHDSQRMSFNYSSEIFLNNAGLVILGAFLPAFFRRLGWLEEKVFKNIHYQYRAAILSQFLADTSTEAPEYQLPLNKLLCGIPVDAPIEILDPINEEEQMKGEELLQAVISHATILKEMSVDGFRTTFLLREGVLKKDAGFWLLRVKRETFDVVLDRFPWSFNIIKLPWMHKAIYVEW